MAETMKATKSGWKCEACKNCGVIRHAADVDVYTMFNRIVAAHATESEGTCVGSGKLRAWQIESPARSTAEGNDP